MPARTSPAELVTIVDDDMALAAGLSMLMDSAGIANRHFRSAEALLAALRIEGPEPRSWQPACVLLDIRMEGASGLQAFDQMVKEGRHVALPVIFMTGHGDLGTAVDVLTRGAFDFVSKPFVSEVLLQKIRNALDRSRAEVRRMTLRSAIQERLAHLTPKERIVLAGIIAGKANREIAGETGNSVRTVELHRAVMFEKMQVGSAVELTALLTRAGLAEDTTDRRDGARLA